MILDDRNERPGVKFNDAELVGIPFRVTVGPRGLADGTSRWWIAAAVKPMAVPVAEAAEGVAHRVARAALTSDRMQPGD